MSTILHWYLFKHFIQLLKLTTIMQHSNVKPRKRKWGKLHFNWFYSKSTLKVFKKNIKFS